MCVGVGVCEVESYTVISRILIVKLSIFYSIPSLYGSICNRTGPVLLVSLPVDLASAANRKIIVF